jgi:transcriptional regulator with XRE-family HTH domain
MEPNHIKSHALSGTRLFLTNMTVHEKIRAIRQSKGFTQDYIAEKLDIDTVNYGRIERGQAKITLERFVEICAILSVQPSNLLEEIEINSLKQQDIMEKIYDEIRQINEKISNLLQ